MILERFEVPGLAHYSYLLGSNGKAAVIDPERNAEPYLQVAERHSLRITHVLETHIHADYASGATRLANDTGAELWLSGHDEGEDYQYAFPHREMRDGEELRVGDLRIVAVHTPGTRQSTSASSSMNKAGAASRWRCCRETSSL